MFLGFSTGDFTAASGRASATAAPSWLWLALGAGVAYLVMRRRK